MRVQVVTDDGSVTFTFGFQHLHFQGVWPRNGDHKEMQIRGATVCYIRHSTQGIAAGKGVARCSVDDHYNKETGRQLALRRALEDAFPAEHFDRGVFWAPFWKAYHSRHKTAQLEDVCYQVDTNYACGGVVVRGNRIVEAAPIFGWMVGQGWSRVKRWPKIRSIRTTTEASGLVKERGL